MTVDDPDTFDDPPSADPGSPEWYACMCVSEVAVCPCDGDCWCHEEE